MSPRILKWRGYRFVFSRDEERADAHASGAENEVRFWLVPDVEMAMNHGLTERRASELRGVVGEKRDEILDAWREPFTG